MSKIELCIDPIGKPRMTSSDRWKGRDVVVRYFNFKDAVVGLCSIGRFVLPDKYRVVFYIGMPKSWSKKKKDRLRGTPHMQKPDLDNLIKSINDSLKSKDETVYYMVAEKYWADEGKIIIEAIE